ncbi:hypothetical protein TNCV_3917941 [Trichonephila clavipes]|nr:hypothetical protein TNCV_3917941 [Trichonephila clavipes]
MTRVTPEVGTPSPNYHTIPMGGRLSSRQIKRASLPYTAGLQWYWARTHDTLAMMRSHHSHDNRRRCGGGLDEDGGQHSDHESYDRIPQELTLSEHPARLTTSHQPEGGTQQVQGADESPEEEEQSGTLQ